MTTRYARHPDVRITALEHEGVALHLGSRRYFSVSETGLVLLQALEQPRTLDELVAGLMERYHVLPELAASSTRAFLDDGVRTGLIVVAGDA